MPSKSTIEFFFKPKTQPPEEAKKCEEKDEGDSADSPAKLKTTEERATPPTRKRLRQVDSDDEDADKAKTVGEPSCKKEEAESGSSVAVPAEEAPKKESSEQPESSRKPKDEKFEVTMKAAKKGEEAKKEEGADRVQSHAKASNDKSETRPAAREQEAASDDDQNDNGQDEDDEEVKEEILKRSSMLDTGKLSWKPGQPVPYSHLATMFEKVEKESKRLEIISLVTDCLRSVIETTPEDLLFCVYLCVNKLAPAHEGVELGIGDMILKKALAEATGRQVKDIQSDYDKVRMPRCPVLRCDVASR